jgi:hypothetical protein
MRLFHPLNSLAVGRNLRLILLSKFWLFFKFSQTYIKKFLKFEGFQICALFSSFCGWWVISDVVIFHLIKVAKISGNHAATWWQKLAADFPSLTLSITMLCIMLNVIMPKVMVLFIVVLSVIMLNAVMLSVAASYRGQLWKSKKKNSERIGLSLLMSILF